MSGKPKKSHVSKSAAAEDEDGPESTSISTDKGTFNLGPVIGKGGFGIVYQGLHVEGGNFVAIKQVRLKNVPKSEIKSLMAEIDLLRSLKHPKIVQYITYLATESTLSIVMEYVENGSLLRILQKFGSIPENLVAVYISQVLEGLTFLHQQGVVHRDIKGANILVTKTGEIKIADFGIASKLNDQNDQDIAMGTPYWMAPEVIELNGATSASDIWSVGCTVIELLSGHPPYFDLPPMTALYRIVQEDHPPLPTSLSSTCVDWLLCVFKKDPEQRLSAEKLLKHRWLKEARAAQEQSKKNLGISESSSPAKSHPHRSSASSSQQSPPKKTKSAMKMDELTQDFDDGSKKIKVKGIKAPPQKVEDNDLDGIGIDLSGLDEIAANAGLPKNVSAGSLMNSLCAHAELPDVNLDDLDFGDISDLKLSSSASTSTSASTAPTMMIPGITQGGVGDEDDLSSILSSLPDSSHLGDSSSKPASAENSSSSLKPSTPAAPVHASAHAPASPPAEEENWGDDFVGEFQTLHLKQPKEGELPALDIPPDTSAPKKKASAKAAAPAPVAPLAKKSVVVVEDDDENWDDVGIPSQKVLKLPTSARESRSKEPAALGRTSSQKQKGAHKSSSPSNSPSSPHNLLTDNVLQRHKRTVSEMVHEKTKHDKALPSEDWDNDFRGSSDVRLMFHVRRDDAAATSLDGLPDVGQADGRGSKLSKQKDAMPKPHVLSSQMLSPTSSSTLGTPINMPMRGIIQKLEPSSPSVTEVADDAFIISGKKAGECIQLQTKAMRDLDVDDVDALDDVDGDDDDDWGDDKEEDKELEERRNENTMLERRLADIFKSIFGENGEVSSFDTVAKALREGFSVIEAHSQSVNQVFIQLGYAPIVDLLDSIKSEMERIASSKFPSSDKEKKVDAALEAALNLVVKSFAFTTELAPLEMMFHQANGWNVIISCINTVRISQNEMHIFAEFISSLSPSAIPIFIGCGGMFALGKLLRDLDKKDAAGLKCLLDTVIQIFTIDDKKPNNDLRRCFIRIGVNNDTLKIAKAYVKDAKNSSIEICNKVGQLFYMLSRRDDAFVKRSLASCDTVKAMLDLIQTQGQKAVEQQPAAKGRDKLLVPTLRRDLVKTMLNVCVSDANNANNLAKAGAIKVLVVQYPQNPDMQIHILRILSRCCKFDKKCMEEAVKEGIIPHLLKSGSDRVLKEDIVLLFTAMAKWALASKKMLECGVLSYLVELLHDRFFLDSALNALDIWAKREKKNVTHPLSDPKTVKSITWAVENGVNEQVLENLKDLLERSKTLSKAMVKDGEIVPVLLAKLKNSHTKPNVKLNSLIALRRLCEFDSVKPKSSLASKYKLVAELTALRKENTQIAAIKKIDEILALIGAGTSSSSSSSV